MNRSVSSEDIDPEIAAALVDFPPFSFDSENLSTIRELFPGGEAPLPGVERADFLVGETAELTIHRPTVAAAPLPCLYWIHGGGLVSGHRHMDDAQLDRWCQALGCAVATVEYRLAPEHPYPAAIDDCLAGFDWLVDRGSQLDLDVSRLGVGGRSAGGGLAAALAMRANERGDSTVRFALLEYPMLDDRQASPSSGLADLPLWNRESNAFGWRSYLGTLVGTDGLSHLAAPARALDLADFPPTCIVVGGVDGFRDEDIDFAGRLMRAGVSTELHVYAGAPHGYHLFPEAAVTRRAVRDVEDWLRGTIALLL